jgi:replicative DNA helicase
VNYKDQYKVFEKNKGTEYIDSAVELCNFDLFTYHAKRIRKFSILRDLESNGFDISLIYSETDEEKLKWFDETEPADLLNIYNRRLMEIERKIVNVESGSHIGDGTDALLESLESDPVQGYDTGINSLNYYLYGLRKKFYLFSARSGVGKTKLLSYLALQTGYYQKMPTLFISTEMPKDEIQTMMIAHIAGINERKILTQLKDLPQEEKQRVYEAKKKLKESNIFIIYMPDFDLEKVENTIKRYILNKKIEMVFLDYIKESVSMIEAMNKRVGDIEGWKRLNLFSERVKNLLVEKYKIGVISATQLNKQGDTAGSGSIPNSCDVWCRLRYANKEELEKYDLNNFFEDEEIMVIENEKNRRGQRDWNVYLGVKLGELKFKELLVTKHDNVVNLPKIEFE